MSFTYLQESGGEFSEVCSTGISLSELSKLNPTAGKFLFKGSLTDACRSSQYGMMFAHSEQTTRNAPDSSSGSGQSATNSESVEAFHARICPMRETKKVLTVNVQGYFSNSQGLLMKYDPVNFCWKTAQTSLFSDLTEYYPELPKWGIMRNGELYPLATWGLGRKEKGGGFWGTVKASCQWMAFKKDSIRNSKFGSDRCALHSVLIRLKDLWPTPLLYERLMGFPDGWSDSKPLETVRFQEWRQRQKLS